VIGFNVVYQQFRAMYDSGCQICCNWSRLIWKTLGKVLLRIRLAY